MVGKKSYLGTTMSVRFSYFVCHSLMAESGTTTQRVVKYSAIVARLGQQLKFHGTFMEKQGGRKKKNIV